MNSYLSAEWSWGVWGWTIGVLAILIFALSVVVKSILFAKPHAASIVAIVVAIVIVGVFLSAILLTPRGYDVRDGKLFVRTLATKFSYDLRQLSDAYGARASKVFSPGTLRTFGVGGFFGYYGYFRNAALGGFLAFVTDKDKLVVLHFADKVLVVSPKEPERFVREIKGSV